MLDHVHCIAIVLAAHVRMQRATNRTEHKHEELEANKNITITVCMDEFVKND